MGKKSSVNKKSSTENLKNNCEWNSTLSYMLYILYENKNNNLSFLYSLEMYTAWVHMLFIV